jgi:hypothetical protein
MLLKRSEGRDKVGFFIVLGTPVYKFKQGMLLKVCRSINKKWFPPVSGIRDICREREKKNTNKK